jgi:hypothetical protein
MRAIVWLFVWAFGTAPPVAFLFAKRGAAPFGPHDALGPVYTAAVSVFGEANARIVLLAIWFAFWTLFVLRLRERATKPREEPSESYGD